MRPPGAGPCTAECTRAPGISVCSPTRQVVLLSSVVEEGDAAAASGLAVGVQQAAAVHDRDRDRLLDYGAWQRR